jgi:hypothetical protein
MVDNDTALILALQEKRKEAPQSDQSNFSVNTYTAIMTPDTASDNIDDVLLAMVTKHSNQLTQPSSHPVHIFLVLSQPAKAAKAQVQDHPTKAAKAQLQDHEISVNGHTYVQQVQSHDIQYSVSQASHSKKSSLVN